MNKIFALDLGTNSIGWALRNPDLIENQIEKFGVLTFNKGVGIDKTGEFSYAANRTKKRSTRRLYQARKYRLWKTLEHLITEGYCPLSIENLNKWRYYCKEEAVKNNNAGRVYPISNCEFDAWIKLDFNKDGKPDYASPYQLRKVLVETKFDFTKVESKYKLGRALYHIAQRRGFKSSRNVSHDTNVKESVENEIYDLQYSENKKNKIIIDLFEKNPEAKTIGHLFALLENQGIRIRENIAQYAIRENYKAELKDIFEFQEVPTEGLLYSKLVETRKNKNNGSIFYKRPLRSQKGLIGKCTLEPGKYRTPISHPSFEFFRAWSFLNNIKYKQKGDYESNWESIPLDLKKKIYIDKFFRKSKGYFPFSEIEDYIKKAGNNWIFNYKSKTTVTSCPVSARLKEIFGDDYQNIKIPKAPSEKSKKDYYDINDIWHILFSYEDQEYVSDFAEIKLGLDPDKIKLFITAWNATPVGYAMLSIHAISKINIFLHKGLIYTEAVLLANIPEIIGKELWSKNEALFIKEIGKVIDENRQQKVILNIVNGLVSKHKNLEATKKFGYKDSSYKLDDSDIVDINTTIQEQFGAKKWNEKEEGDKDVILNTIKDCYQAYFISSGFERRDINNERHFIIKSNGIHYYKSDSGYYRLPKLIDTLGEFLQLNFNVSDDQLLKIYHPSEINIYPPAKLDKNGDLKLGSPKTDSFKNPMAMRTLHELRKLVNYLIETSQIDCDTRIVVEVARELNDANKRWAIETWQRQREAENIEYSLAIEQLVTIENNVEIDSTDEGNIDKMRLWHEQTGEESVPPVTEDKKEIKGIRWSENKKDSYKEIVAKKDMLDKYRLWLEQDCICIYTGNIIKITDLFKENIIDFEHTIPRSISFDNSLANLTVCYADYNRTVKKNQIPFNLNNYEKDYGNYSAILPRLEKWKEKVERIKQQIDFWVTKSKKASDKVWKDKAIRERHLWQMELDYWRNKVDRFTIEEVTSGFKNSQKVDTQLISKYAYHYLKSYFEKVDVQKGAITAEFRKIYGLQIPNQKKDRSKHSHHAKDAAVLTLIPIAAKRDEILKNYYEHQEKKQPFLIVEPFKGFKREFIWNIDESILINNISNNQALTPAKRVVRKRGKKQFIEGTNIAKISTGDCIRGQLHLDTFYGAIKPALLDKDGNIIRDEKGKIVQNKEIRYVLKIPFLYKKDQNSPGFKTIEEIENQIVDKALFKQIAQQVKDVYGNSLKDALEPQNGIFMLDKSGGKVNKIRHIRCWTSISEPLSIKKQTYLSKHEYKNHYWAGNGENVVCALYEYETIDKNGTIKKSRDTEIINLNDLAKLKSFGLMQNNELGIYRKNKEGEIITNVKGAKDTPYALLMPGMKVIFFDAFMEDLKKHRDQTEAKYIKMLSDRTYKIVKFSGGRITFQHHLEARDDIKLKEAYKKEQVFMLDESGKEVKYGVGGTSGFTRSISDTYKYNGLNNYEPWPRLLYSKDWLNMAIEGKHFEIKPDGEIKWLL